MFTRYLPLCFFHKLFLSHTSLVIYFCNMARHIQDLTSFVRFLFCKWQPFYDTLRGFKLNSIKTVRFAQIALNVPFKNIVINLPLTKSWILLRNGRGTAVNVAKQGCYSQIWTMFSHKHILLCCYWQISTGNSIF